MTDSLKWFTVTVMESERGEKKLTERSFVAGDRVKAVDNEYNEEFWDIGATGTVVETMCPCNEDLNAVGLKRYEHWVEVAFDGQEKTPWTVEINSLEKIQ